MSATLHTLVNTPAPDLARRLDAFEKQFTYPLGPGRFFRISHGEDYPRFYRAIGGETGDAACFALEIDDRIVGTLGVALRELLLPDGSAQTVAYLGDLKITPDARGGRNLPRLMSAVRDWVGGRTASGLGIVMDGTPVSPARYTGRLGFPLFDVLGTVMVLKIALPREWTCALPENSASDGLACYTQLSRGRCATPCRGDGERSELLPRWFVLSDGEACGLLEDTLRAKRLTADDGVEMRSAHLSCFAYRNPADGARLIQNAGALARETGYPALFVSAAAPDAESLCAELKTPALKAPATLFGTGLPSSSLWNINTAEI